MICSSIYGLKLIIIPSKQYFELLAFFLEAKLNMRSEYFEANSFRMTPNNTSNALYTKLIFDVSVI